MIASSDIDIKQLVQKAIVPIRLQNSQQSAGWFTNSNYLSLVDVVYTPYVKGQRFSLLRNYVSKIQSVYRYVYIVNLLSRDLKKILLPCRGYVFSYYPSSPWCIYVQGRCGWWYYCQLFYGFIPNVSVAYAHFFGSNFDY